MLEKYGEKRNLLQCWWDIGTTIIDTTIIENSIEVP